MIVKKKMIQNCHMGLPWWRSGWESACQCRGHGFEPWSRRLPHATEQLGLCTPTTEPVLWSLQATTTEAHEPQLLKPTHLESVLCNKGSQGNEKPVHRNENTAQRKIKTNKFIKKKRKGNTGSIPHPLPSL